MVLLDSSNFQSTQTLNWNMDFDIYKSYKLNKQVLISLPFHINNEKP